MELAGLIQLSMIIADIFNKIPIIFLTSLIHQICHAIPNFVRHPWSRGSSPNLFSLVRSMTAQQCSQGIMKLHDELFKVI